MRVGKISKGYDGSNESFETGGRRQGGPADSCDKYRWVKGKWIATFDGTTTHVTVDGHHYEQCRCGDWDPCQTDDDANPPDGTGSPGNVLNSDTWTNGNTFCYNSPKQRIFFPCERILGGDGLDSGSDRDCQCSTREPFHDEWDVTRWASSPGTDPTGEYAAGIAIGDQLSNDHFVNNSTRCGEGCEGG
jgi:hypothetical protein